MFEARLCPRPRELSPALPATHRNSKPFESAFEPVNRCTLVPTACPPRHRGAGRFGPLLSCCSRSSLNSRSIMFSSTNLVGSWCGDYSEWRRRFRHENQRSLSPMRSSVSNYSECCKRLSRLLLLGPSGARSPHRDIPLPNIPTVDIVWMPVLAVAAQISQFARNNPELGIIHGTLGTRFNTRNGTLGTFSRDFRYGHLLYPVVPGMFIQ